MQCLRWSLRNTEIRNSERDQGFWRRVGMERKTFEEESVGVCEWITRFNSLLQAWVTCLFPVTA